MSQYEDHPRLRGDEDTILPNQIYYQPIRLKKEMGEKVKDCPVTPIASCEGLDCIEPETWFIEGSVLQKLIDEKNIEFLICVAMYNEGEEEFLNTMKGIMANMKEFENHAIPSDRIACIFIVDGTSAFMKTFNDGEKNSMKTFQKFLDPEAIKLRYSVNNIEDVTKQLEPDEEIAHCFEQIYQEKDVTLNLIFCVKQRNLRKLNTHLWFFCGFCKMIEPRFVMLLDVGTMPHDKALWMLYEAMDLDENVAGCCGEICPMNPQLFNWVQPAQVVEYKYSHIFDKALESVCGYISVLPGAFSAYRWDQLIGNPKDGSPLWTDYFLSMTHPELMNAYYSNIYLAEDRVLTLALVSMKNRANILRYVRNSIAETDVPDMFYVLLMQRRRWINGSWFALIDFMKQFSRIYGSNHTLKTKIIFTLEFFWYWSTIAISWVMVGCFALMMETLLDTMGMDTQGSDYGFSIASLIMIMYSGLLVTTFIFSLAVKPKQVENAYKVISGLFSFYMLASFVLMIRFLTGMDSGMVGWVYALAFILAFVMLAIPFLYGALGLILKNLIMFLMLCPTYVNVFFIYAICNTHDCTWGNRDSAKTEGEVQQADAFALFRCRWAVIWVATNLSFYIIFKELSDQESSGGFNVIYMIGVYSFIALMSRCTGSIIFFIQEKYYKKTYAEGEPAKAALTGKTRNDETQDEGHDDDNSFVTQSL